MNKKKKGLQYQILLVTLIPIIFLGVVITISSSQTFTTAMDKQVEVELKNLSYTILDTLDTLYPGDYNVIEKDNQIAVFKGNVLLNDNYRYIDVIKEDTGINISIFYNDIRVITTLRDEEGQRVVGTKPHAVVIREVLNGRKSKLYNNTYVNNKGYFAYYTPIYNSNEKCVGMIALGKPLKEVSNNIFNAILPLSIFAVIATLVTMYVSICYTKKVVYIIKSLQDSMTGVSKGDLNVSVNRKILQRDDEFGSIGQSIVDMQRSLRVLIQQDSLTGLYNRRYADKCLKEIVNKAKQTGMPYAVCIGDIDLFKNVNDTYGHDCGDIVLQSIAQLLKKSMFAKGLVARWGGEEFLLVFDRTEYEESCDILDGILSNISELELAYRGDKVRVTMTFGMAEGNSDLTAEQILKLADNRLYYGKAHGRNIVISET